MGSVQSKIYDLLKSYVTFMHTLFYRRIYVSGLDKIPPNKPIIFAPNHQNALMDPLALLLNIDQQPVFLARADIFKSPIIRRVLIFLKLLPVYRVRDGFKAVENNNKTFDLSINILEANQQIALFPEARHHGQHFLLPLKKGIPRIAFLAEEKNNFTLNLQVVPVGIHYSDYYSYKSDLWLTIGEPIAVKRLKPEYEKDPPRTHLLLRDQIADGLKPLILNIPNPEFYDEYLLLLEILGDAVHTKLSLVVKGEQNRLKVQQKTIEYISRMEADKKSYLLQLATQLNTLLSENGLTKNDVLHNARNYFVLSARLLVTSPIFLAGIIPSLPHLIVPWFFYRRLKDRQFESSYKFVFFLLLAPLSYGITAFYLLPFFFNINIFIATGSFLLLFYIGSYSLLYMNLLKLAFREVKTSVSRKKLKPEISKITQKISDLFT